MLGNIKLYLGTRFLGGLRTLLHFAVLILKYSRHIVLGQHLFPKLMTRTSLFIRSWQRQAWFPQRPFLNIITDQLFKETALLPVSLTSKICESFFGILHVLLCLFCYCYTIYYKNGYPCLCSTFYFCVDFMPLVRVHVVRVHKHC